MTSYSQSKKEVIEELNKRVDSLDQVIDSERLMHVENTVEIVETFNDKIDSLNATINRQNNEYERHVILYNKLNETLLLNSRKHEIEIEYAINFSDSIQNLNDQLREENRRCQTELEFLIDSIQKLNDQLQEENRRCGTEVKLLIDSISHLNNEILNSINSSEWISLLNQVRSEFFFIDDFPEQNELVVDSLYNFCNEDKCARFLLTRGFLVASYVASFGNDFGTMIIDLHSREDLMSDPEIGFYVYGFEKEKNILFIEKSGYDDDGRWWRSGTWSFDERIARLGEKEY
jgi:hypothetical protein